MPSVGTVDDARILIVDDDADGLRATMLALTPHVGRCDEAVQRTRMRRAAHRPRA